MNLLTNLRFLQEDRPPAKEPFIFYGVGGAGGIWWVAPPVKYNDPSS